MATGIPLPGQPGEALLKGLDTGSGMFARLMQPIIQREELAQRAKQFQEELALRKAAAGRAAANSDLNRAILQERLKGLQRQNDPNAAANEMQRIMEIFGGNKNQPQVEETQMQSFLPSIQQEEQNQSFLPSINQEAVSPFEAQQINESHPKNTGIDLNLMRQNPLLRAFFKKKFGIDPLEQSAQTPEEKQQMALDLFKKKEQIKKGVTGGEIPLTTAMKTKLQGVITGVDNSLPVIQELITEYKKLPVGSEFFNPSSYAAYNAKANSIIEPLINAFGLNITDATKEMMHDQVFRKTNEPLEKYRNRLVDLAKEIIRRRNDSNKTLNAGAISPKAEFTNEFFEGLKNIEKKIINGKEYEKINGEWHEI